MLKKLFIFSFLLIISGKVFAEEFPSFYDTPKHKNENYYTRDTTTYKDREIDPSYYAAGNEYLVDDLPFSNSFYSYHMGSLVFDDLYLDKSSSPDLIGMENDGLTYAIKGKIGTNYRYYSRDFEFSFSDISMVSKENKDDTVNTKILSLGANATREYRRKHISYFIGAGLGFTFINMETSTSLGQEGETGEMPIFSKVYAGFKIMLEENKEIIFEYERRIYSDFEFSNISLLDLYSNSFSVGYQIGF